MPKTKKTTEDEEDGYNPSVRFVDAARVLELGKVANVFRDQGYPRERTGMANIYNREDREYLELDPADADALKKGQRIHLYSKNENKRDVLIGILSRHPVKGGLHFFPSEKSLTKAKKADEPWPMIKTGQALLITPSEHIHLSMIRKDHQARPNPKALGHLLVYVTGPRWNKKEPSDNALQTIRIFNLDSRPLKVVHKQIEKKKSTTHVI